MAKYEPVKRTDRDDETLIARIVESDGADGFGELYQKYYRRVYSICLRMFGSIEEAEDMTQNTFIHMLKKLKTFRGESALTTWMHRMTVNMCLMEFRRRKGQKEDITDDGEIPDRPDPRHKPSQHVNAIMIDRALKKLPSGYRKVFILHEIEGYEHEEIGVMLGRSSGTSKSQNHKARKAMARLIMLENDNSEKGDDMPKPAEPLTKLCNGFFLNQGIKVAEIKNEEMGKIANAIVRAGVSRGEVYELNEVRKKVIKMRSQAIFLQKQAR